MSKNRVEWKGYQVRSIDPRRPDSGELGWAAFFLSDEPYPLEKERLEDFTVYQLNPIAWWE